MFIFSENHSVPVPISTKQLKERELSNHVAYSSQESRKKRYVTSALLLVVPILLLGIFITFNWNNSNGGYVLKSPPPAENHIAGLPTRKEDNDSTIIHPIIIEQKRFEISPIRDTVVTHSPKVGKKHRVINLPEGIVQIRPSYAVVDKTIENIVLHVQNNSDNDLDLVVIEVHYSSVGGSTRKKETLYIKDIPALQAKSIITPNANTLERVVYKIALVSSKDAKLYLVSR